MVYVLLGIIILFHFVYDLLLFVHDRRIRYRLERIERVLKIKENQEQED